MLPGKLYLTLINPKEASRAFEEGWHGTQGIRSSLQQGNFEVLFQDKRGSSILTGLLELIK